MIPRMPEVVIEPAPLVRTELLRYACSMCRSEYFGGSVCGSCGRGIHPRSQEDWAKEMIACGHRPRP